MGGYSDTYSDLYDPAFPLSLLDARVELNLGGTWTNVTPFVYERDKITVTYGHPDETTTCNPTRAALTLGNRDGRFSPRNPVGAYYGLIGRNTPMRVSVPQGSVHLRMEDDSTSYASCPDRASLDITGDIDVRIDLELSNYAQMTLATKWNSSTDRAWAFRLNPTGTLAFEYVDAVHGDFNATGTATIPLGRIALRATMQANNGLGGSTTTFYTAPTIAGPWTQISQVVKTNGVITLANSSAPVSVGFGYGYIVTDTHSNHTGPNGKFYGFRLYNGIGGTLVASPDFTAQVPGTAMFADAQANIWSMAGTAQLSDRRYRAHTEVPAWPPRWDPTGNDIWAPIEGSGLLRRYQQGTPPKLSAMYRGYALLTGAAVPVAYWPCEDGTQASVLASGLAAGAPMTVAATANGPTFAGDTGFACSQPIPTLGGSTWTGSVNTSPSGQTSNTLRFLMHVPAAGETNGATIATMYTTGTVARLTLVYGTGGALTLTGYSHAGTQLFTSGAITFATGSVNGQLARVSMELKTSGADIAWSMAVLPANGVGFAGLDAGTLTSATLGAATSVVINQGGGLSGTAVGHISVQTVPTDLFGTLFGPLNAWIGENAGTRFARLCSEQGVNCRVYGFPTDTVAMGYQDVNDFVSLLQECEATDGGLIFEPKQTLGLGYRTRVSMFNQAAKLALTYSTAQLSAPVEPTDDDQQVRNDYTVTRANASSTRAYQATGALSVNPPPAGVGDYGQQVSLSLGADTQLPDQAGWLVHMGTVDDVRYPSLSVDLARSEMAALYYQAQDTGVGDRLTVASTPGFLPPDGVSQVVRGGVEVCYGYVFTEQFTCAPESPFKVAVFDDAVLGRADTDGSTLTGPTYSPTATTLLVATANAGSPLWTTSGGDFPFDIEVAGERMTVTNITGTSSPQTFTVTRSVNGVVKTQYAGADVRLFQPAILSM